MNLLARRRSLVGLTGLVTLALVAGGSAAPVAQASGSSFKVGLIGDTGYSSSQDKDLLSVRRSMAGSGLAFEVHDGDIQKAGTPCTDERLKANHDVFDGFDAPFVYTPGDNEWNNCSNSSARLSAIRRIFFPDSRTLGRRTMSVDRQSGTPENARWDRDGVFFATLNVPGPRGGGPKTADLDWLSATFDDAEAAGAAGVMIIWQDDPFSGGGSSSLVDALKARTEAFGRPVVLVHGDTHRHRVDHPWSDVPNFTRVETFAESGSRSWVKATIDPSSSKVFSFSSVKA